jgi:hypothetical protein
MARDIPGWPGVDGFPIFSRISRRLTIFIEFRISTGIKHTQLSRDLYWIHLSGKDVQGMDIVCAQVPTDIPCIWDILARWAGLVW